LQLASIDSVETTDDNSAPSAHRIERTGEPFNLYTFRAPEGLLWTKWRNLQFDLLSDVQVISGCRSDPDQCRSPAALRLLSLVDRVRPMPRHAAIAIINRAINLSIHYVSDIAQHGVPDLWSAPLATLTSGQGDCEDYAIAKYEAMRQLGIAPDDLRILLVRDRAVGQDHAVLSVQYGGRWNVLDNRHSHVLGTTEVPQFLPLFSINHAGVKLFAASYAGIGPGRPDDIAPASTADGED
jgi:predicted transglutaminase-like cysteine proteinase